MKEPTINITTTSSVRPQQPSLPPRPSPRGYYGRGGAGNHAAAVEATIRATRLAEAEEEEAQRQRRGRDSAAAAAAAATAECLEMEMVTVKKPEGVVVRARRNDF